jgi:predicted N-formylglutamate amidohydrolase
MTGSGRRDGFPTGRERGTYRWPGGLLGPEDPDPVLHMRAGSHAPVLFVCDHGGNAVPRGLDLGVEAGELDRHIGYDIGALGVAKHLSEALEAELIAQRYSRLVIDCNRPPHAASAMPARVDGTDVPANAALSPPGAAARVAEIFMPYHGAIAASLDKRLERGEPTVLFAVHSYTPHHGDFPGERPWPVSFLFRHRPGLSRALRDILADEGLLVGMNEPYDLDDFTDYTIPVHAEARGLTSALVEIRQDGIGEAAGQAAWAARLARVLPAAIERATHP